MLHHPVAVVLSTAVAVVQSAAVAVVLSAAAYIYLTFEQQIPYLNKKIIEKYIPNNN